MTEFTPSPKNIELIEAVMGGEDAPYGADNVHYCGQILEAITYGMDYIVLTDYDTGDVAVWDAARSDDQQYLDCRRVIASEWLPSDDVTIDGRGWSQWTKIEQAAWLMERRKYGVRAHATGRTRVVGHRPYPSDTNSISGLENMSADDLRNLIAAASAELKNREA